jgi:hypothetical protein
MNTLPDELIYTILSYATGFEKYHEKDAIAAHYQHQRRSPLSSVFEIPYERHRIVRVCKRWHTIGVEFLYSSVILRNPIGLLSLKYSLARYPRLAGFVQAFSILSENTWLYSDPELRTVLDACPHLLVFCATRTTVLPISQQETVLYMNIRDTFNEHARYEDATAQLQLNRFTHLQTLHLTRVYPCSFHWHRTPRDRISLPHLKTLILEFDDPHDQVYENICKWSLPSLSVLQIRHVMSYTLCAMMHSFQSTLAIVDATVFTDNAVYAWTPCRFAMPYLRHFSISGGMVDFGSLFGSVTALETLEFGLDWVREPRLPYDSIGWAFIKARRRSFVLDWATRSKEEGALPALNEVRFRIEYPEESDTILLAEISGVFRRCLSGTGIEILDGI